MPGFPVSKSAVSNFVHAFIAVVGGNAAYLLLMPYLPAGAQHVPFRIDVGLLVDFWFCLVVFGIVKAVAKKRGEAKLHRQ